MESELRFKVRALLQIMFMLLAFPGQLFFPLERREPELCYLARARKHMG